MPQTMKSMRANTPKMINESIELLLYCKYIFRHFINEIFSMRLFAFKWRPFELTLKTPELYVK